MGASWIGYSYLLYDLIESFRDLQRDWGIFSIVIFSGEGKIEQNVKINTIQKVARS